MKRTYFGEGERAKPLPYPDKSVVSDGDMREAPEGVYVVSHMGHVPGDLGNVYIYREGSTESVRRRNVRWPVEHLCSGYEDPEAGEAVAEMNEALGEYIRATAGVVREQRERMLSLQWFPKTLVAEGKSQGALRHLRAKRNKLGDGGEFVSYVAKLVQDKANAEAIRRATGGQEVDPRYLAYLILHALNTNPRLGTPGAWL